VTRVKDAIPIVVRTGVEGIAALLPSCASNEDHRIIFMHDVSNFLR